MSKKLDELLRERTWRGVISRAVCTISLVVLVAWLPEIATFGEAIVFKRQFIINQNKYSIIKIISCLFLIIIITRDALTIKHILKNRAKEKQPTKSIKNISNVD
ncbi:hypothetical protein [Cupriavidus basilensis]|uniref:hypothetical protein n=1 Tax=Cupriavidus basilensis TaxID=68895 RepID=UPI0011856550|nr:hypothetical protein [Cupriavidus basilensis]